MPFDGTVPTVHLVKRGNVRSQPLPPETEDEREVRLAGDPNHRFSKGGRHVKIGH